MSSIASPEPFYSMARRAGDFVYLSGFGPVDRAGNVVGSTYVATVVLAFTTFARAGRLEAEGRDIIHLEIGQPDVDTFGNISQARIRAIQEGHTRYCPIPGVWALREAIAEDTGRRLGIKVQPTQVLIGPGAKTMLFFPTLALVRPGDEVIYPDPGFPTYRAMIGVAGGVPVPVPLREEEDFGADIQRVAAELNVSVNG